MRRIDNPPHPDAYAMEWLDAPPPARLEVFEDTSRTILSENQSPDLPFRWSVNPYRGCLHACAYCYARPTHEYLGLGAGTDFDTKILVKRRAPELLRAAFMRRSWQGELVAFSGNTDCYQPLESRWRLTRRCLEVCAAFRNPVDIVTKSPLLQRDLDVLQQLHHEASLTVFLSIPFADDATARALEPGAPRVSRRFAAVQALAEAGIPTGVAVSPLIPGLNDADVPRILEQARDRGARYAQSLLLRLPGSARPVFLQRLQAAFPERARRVQNHIRAVRGGKLDDSRFFARHRGRGVYGDLIARQWEVHMQRLRLQTAPRPARCTFRRPSRQATLF